MRVWSKVEAEVLWQSEQWIGGGESGPTFESRDGSALRHPQFAGSTGIRRMREDAKRHGAPAPDFEDDGFFTATFRPRREPVHAEQVDTEAKPKHVAPQVTPHVAPQVTPHVAAVLREARSAASRDDLLNSARLKDRVHFLRAYLQPLLAAGWLEMTIPDKPRSSKQRYRTTPAGLRALEGTSQQGTDGDSKRRG